MANPWFRMYSEFAHDPKVQSMPEEMQRRLVMIFCLQCDGVTETLHETEIAYYLHISDDDLAQTKELFLRKGFIDERWNAMNWNKRQFISDSSTERVRKHRDHKRKGHETPVKREGNVTETPPDTDTESDNNSPYAREENQADTENLSGRDFPEGLDLFHYASGILEECSLLAEKSTIWATAEAIRLLARKEACPHHVAAERMQSRALAAKKQGISVNRFWFADAKWELPPRKPCEATVGFQPTAVKQEQFDRIPVGLDADAGKSCWQKVRATLGQKMLRHSFETWIEPMRSLGIGTDNVLYLRVPSVEFKSCAKYFDEADGVGRAVKLLYVPEQGRSLQCVG